MIECIHIERLQVQAHVGVPDAERSQPQPLVLSVTFSPAVTQLCDELGATADYSAVAKAVRETVSRRQYKLIETLAEEVAAELLAQFDLRRVAVEVRKFVLDDAEYVSVTAVRQGELS